MVGGERKVKTFAAAGAMIRSRWRDDRPTRGRLGERVALRLVGRDTLLGTTRI